MNVTNKTPYKTLTYKITNIANTNIDISWIDESAFDIII